MTEREELRAKDYLFYCFTTREARASFSLNNDKDFHCVCIDETFCRAGFPVYFLGVKKLHHIPVKYTPARKEGADGFILR